MAVHKKTRPETPPASSLRGRRMARLVPAPESPSDDGADVKHLLALAEKAERGEISVTDITDLSPAERRRILFGDR